MPTKNKKETIDNNCLECAFFVKHYANLDGTFYLVNGCKHCINHELTFKEREKRMSNTVKCEYWQKEQIQIDERREHIEYKLKRMAKQIDEIAQILREESKTEK